MSDLSAVAREITEAIRQERLIFLTMLRDCEPEIKSPKVSARVRYVIEYLEKVTAPLEPVTGGVPCPPWPKKPVWKPDFAFWVIFAALMFAAVLGISMVPS